jgi:WD40 repeat protein
VESSGIARIWSTVAAAPGDGECLQLQSGDCARLKHARLSPDGRWAAGTTDKAAFVWDLTAGTPFAPKPLGKSDPSLGEIAWSPADPTEITTTSANGTLRIFRIENQSLATEHRGYTSGTVSVRLNPDGKSAASLSDAGEVRRWELGTEVLRERLHQSILECLPVEALRGYLEGLEELKDSGLDAQTMHDECENTLAHKRARPPVTAAVSGSAR